MFKIYIVYRRIVCLMRLFLQKKYVLRDMPPIIANLNDYFDRIYRKYGDLDLDRNLRTYRPG